MAYKRDDDILIDLDEEEDFEQLRAAAEARRAASAPPCNPDLEVPELSAGKTHHLFISHSEEDGEWAQQLVQSLEQEHGLKCLWPRREFTPGHEIADLIQRGIATSMKVLFIMTPASMESGWCKYERNWAFVLSVEERENRTIPLLLSPCEVPNIFKTINYIDVPKGEDYVYRILRSFDKENDLKDIVPDFEQFLKKQVNGLSQEIYGEKRLKYVCRGPAWAFRAPTEYQRYLLRRLGSKFSEDVYNKVKDLVNTSNHLKFYSLTHSCGHCCVSYCCSLIMIVLGVFSMLFIAEILTHQFRGEGQEVITILVLIMFSVVLAILVFILDKFNYWKTWKIVRNFSLDQVRRTKMLVNYKTKRCEPPCLVFMYYDINPCMNYIRDGILRTPAFNDIEDPDARKEKAQDIAEKTVLNFLRKNYEFLFTWGKLDVSEVNRHATFANKKCLCEMLHAVYWTADI